METLDFVYWFRQIAAISYGLSVGLLHLQGMYVLIGFIVFIIVMSNLYCSKVLNVSEEDF